MDSSRQKHKEDIAARFIGVELYFEDLEQAKRFYRNVLGLRMVEEEPGRHAKFESGSGFICLEKTGVESYPSRDKAVLFFEVPDLGVAMATIGLDRIIQSAPGWAVLHDPEGHTILLLQR